MVRASQKGGIIGQNVALIFNRNMDPVNPAATVTAAGVKLRQVGGVCSFLGLFFCSLCLL